MRLGHCKVRPHAALKLHISDCRLKRLELDSHIFGALRFILAVCAVLDLSRLLLQRRNRTRPICVLRLVINRADMDMFNRWKDAGPNITCSSLHDMQPPHHWRMLNQDVLGVFGFRTISESFVLTTNELLILNNWMHTTKGVRRKCSELQNVM